MNYLGSQMWQGKARYLLAPAGEFANPWAPYAQLDFAVSCAHSLANDEFEKRAVCVFMELGRNGRPLLLVMLDEAMRSIWRVCERDVLLQMASEVMSSIPAKTEFAVAEYALVRHILQSERSGLDAETHDLNAAVDALNPFAAARRALIQIRIDFANAYEATLQSVVLGNCFAAHEYVVQHYHRKLDRDSIASEKLRALLMELAMHDDPVALLDLALASRADHESLILSAAAGNWQAIWNVQNDASFGLSVALAQTCSFLQTNETELKNANAQLMQAALQSCWNRLCLGNGDSK